MMSVEDKFLVSKEMLAQIINELKRWSAPATVLLTLYVPPGRPVSDVLNLLREEYSITDNIKLKRTKAAVQTALTMAIDRLSSIQKIPKNGLAAFCGVDIDSGKDICLMFSPPEPVQIFFYRTDKWFHTEYLEDMLKEKEVYGLIIVERDECTIGVLSGSRVEVIANFMSYIPGKHSKGGQSQRRYDRIIDQMVQEFYKEVGERANNAFLPLLEQGVLKGIIIGGPGFSKKDFFDGDYLDFRLKKLVFPQLVDVSYQDEAGLRELVLKAEGLIKGHKYIEAVKATEELKLHMAKADGLAIFGDEVFLAGEVGNLSLVIANDDHPRLEDIKALVEKCEARLVLVPSSMPEGAWLKSSFGGLAGLLKYKQTSFS